MRFAFSVGALLPVLRAPEIKRFILAFNVAVSIPKT